MVTFAGGYGKKVKRQKKLKNSSVTRASVSCRQTGATVAYGKGMGGFFSHQGEDPRKGPVLVVIASTLPFVEERITCSSLVQRREKF
jgi:hypothetical protein